MTHFSVQLIKEEVAQPEDRRVWSLLLTGQQVRSMTSSDKA